MSKPKRGKRFIYSLATLLKVRDIKERQEKEKFTKAEQKVQEEKLKEEQAKKDRLAHLNYVSSLLSSDELPSLTTIQMHQEHVKTMKKREDEQVEVVKQAEQARDDQREEVIKATKEKRIIEKDKEKTREAWKKMMDKLDSQFLDEIASIKFASKMIQDAENDKS